VLGLVAGGAVRVSTFLAGQNSRWLTPLVTAAIVGVAVVVIDRLRPVHRGLAFMRRRWMIWPALLLILASWVVFDFYRTRHPFAFKPKPPPATLSSSQGEVRAVIGTFCWHGDDLSLAEKILSGWTTGLCADTVGSPTPIQTLTTSPGETLRFRVDYREPPTEISVSKIRKSDAAALAPFMEKAGISRDEPLSMDLGRGIHAIQIFARWEEDGASRGDAFYYFRLSIG
jgi:hypothetical protein